MITCGEGNKKQSFDGFGIWICKSGHKLILFSPIVVIKTSDVIRMLVLGSWYLVVRTTKGDRWR